MVKVSYKPADHRTATFTFDNGREVTVHDCVHPMTMCEVITKSRALASTPYPRRVDAMFEILVQACALTKCEKIVVGDLINLI